MTTNPLTPPPPPGGGPRGKKLKGFFFEGFPYYMQKKDLDKGFNLLYMETIFFGGNIN